MSPGLKNVRGFPVEIIVDRNGEVVDVRNSSGFSEKWKRKLEERLEPLLSSRY